MKMQATVTRQAMAASVTMAHERQTAYTARYIGICNGREVYTTATQKRDGRMAVCYDLASGEMTCECGACACEHIGAARIEVEMRHEMPRTWSTRASAETVATWLEATGWATSGARRRVA